MFQTHLVPTWVFFNIHESVDEVALMYETVFDIDKSLTYRNLFKLWL